MKKSFSIFLILFFAIGLANSQEIVEKRYFRNKAATIRTDEQNAKVLETTSQEPNGTLKYELRSTRDNKLLRLRYYKDDIPVGEWLTSDGRKLNYNFDLPYTENDCEGIVYYDLLEGIALTPVMGFFEPPVFQLEENNFRRYVVRRIVYPEASYEKGVQGKTLFKFVIDESGKLVDLTVLKGAETGLDKEAARIMRQSPVWKPAMIDGKPIRVCIKMAVIYLFQQV